MSKIRLLITSPLFKVYKMLLFVFKYRFVIFLFRNNFTRTQKIALSYKLPRISLTRKDYLDKVVGEKTNKILLNIHLIIKLLNIYSNKIMLEITFVICHHFLQ